MDTKTTQKKRGAPGRLPDRLVVLPNPDKKWHEKWTPDRSRINFTHPYRMTVVGVPNSGKSNAILNCILHADPPFEAILCVHGDPEGTSEYERINATMLDDIPDYKSFKGERKTLVIIDDLELKQMTKAQLKNLDRLFGYVSTHKNVSIILTSQSFYNVPPIARRCSNVFVLWKTPDLSSFSTVAKRVGMKSDKFLDLFHDHVRDIHDSIWIDLTAGTKYPFRLNGFEPLTPTTKPKATE